MKRLLFVIVLIPLLLAGCAPGDSWMEPIYLDDTLPWEDATRTLGSPELRWADFYTVNATISGDTTLGGPVTLEGDGEIWLEYRLNLSWSTVQAHGKPTHVTRGIFDGYSLPIYAADNEELFFEICIPDRWKGPAWTYLQDVGDEPGQPGIYDGSLYIPSEATDEVYVYDGETFALSGAVGDRPIMALEYDGILYVTCYQDDNVWQYNGVRWSIASAVGNRPQGMAIFEDTLYVVCRNGAGIQGEMWRFDGATWELDPALGLGGAAGAVGNGAEWACAFDGKLFVSCGDVDDDIWVRDAGAWAKDDDVGNQPQVMHEHDGHLYVTSEADDEIWRTDGGGAWNVVTNIQTTTGGAPIGLEEYDDNLFAACFDSVWSDHHTVDAYVVPFWNENSDFTVVTADQPMFFEVYDDKLYCIAKTGDGVWVYEGETAKTSIHVWLTSAQAAATDAFRVEIEYENFTPDVNIAPVTASSVYREVMTGVAAQFHVYGLHIPIDLTGCAGDDSLAIRLIRIASSDEIAGELAVQHAAMIFKCDKIGSPEP